VFATVARSLSFSQAARALHLTQPAVSQQVAALERDLGVRLFDRSSRRVALTRAGAALLDRSNDLLRALADARRTVAAAEGRFEGTLRVAASLTVGTYVLPPALAGLATQYPKLRLDVRVENTNEVVASLLAGGADVGFVEGRAAEGGVVLEPLRDDELVVIGHPRHRFADVDVITLADLMGEPIVVREPGSGTREVAEDHLRRAGADPAALRIVAELTAIEAIKAAVEAGLGVSVISRSAIARELQLGTLVARRIAGVPMSRDLAVAWPPNAVALPAAVKLVALVRGQLGRVADA
jgi:DNA-binding transcriptional LysR family regulator